MKPEVSDCNSCEAGGSLNCMYKNHFILTHLEKKEIVLVGKRKGRHIS